MTLTSPQGHHGLAGASRRRPGTWRNGFSLIELLVVIAILSLLVSILLPSLKQAKYLARLAVCGSNLRNIGTSIFNYTSDNEGYYPDIPPRSGQANTAHSHPLIRRVYNGGNWDGRDIYDTYGSAKTLQCPLAPGTVDRLLGSQADFIMGSYEFWAGATMDYSEPDSAMRRIGDRPVWNTFQFRVLAADTDRAAQWAPWCFVSSHNGGDLVADPIDNGSYYIGAWRNKTARYRQPVTRHFLMDDGSVQRIRDIPDDGGSQTVPVPSEPGNYCGLGFTNGLLPYN